MRQKECMRIIGYAVILLLITFAYNAQSNGAINPANEENIIKTLVSDGRLDIEKLKQFRDQLLFDIQKNNAQRRPDTASNIFLNRIFNLNAASQSGSFIVLDSTRSFMWMNDQWIDSLKYKYYSNVRGDLEYSIKQYWENDQWEYNINLGFTYDEYGRLIERIVQDWNSIHPEFDYIIRRLTFNYNFNGSIADSIKQYWNFNSELWGDDAKSKYSYVYDGNGNQTEYLNQVSRWDDSPPYWKWTDDSRILSTFNGNNNLTESVLQGWDEGMFMWYNISRETFAYDGHGNRTDSSTFGWVSDQWVEDMKITFSYDNDDNQIEELHQYYEEGQWINSWKFTYDYDANGNQTRFLEQYWDDGTWENSWEEILAYDANNNVTENTGRYWNWSINVWRTYDRHTYTYDIDGNQIEYLGQLWESSQWISDFKRISYYSLITTTETGVGDEVEITLDENIVLLFDSVSAAGSISVTIGDDGPGSDIYEFLPVDSADYIYITTDAEYVGQVELCFPYNGALLTDEEEDLLRVFHYTQGQWVNITSSHDKVNDIICGITNNLSPFAIGFTNSSTHLCGDANDDGGVNISDAVYIINCVFKGGPCAEPDKGGDANCDDIANIADAVYLVNLIFRGGPAPCATCP
jgi:hypothetical protein